MMLNNTDLGPGTIYATKMIIDPVTKKARSEDNGRNKHSVFDNSLVRKSDFEEIETYFTEIKGSVEKINKERPEEIKERNIDNVMIYVSALVEPGRIPFLLRRFRFCHSANTQRFGRETSGKRRKSRPQHESQARTAS